MNGNGHDCAEPGLPAAKLPSEIVVRLQAFLATGLTGNIELNIKEGRVMGAKFVEIFTVQGLSSHRRQHKPRPVNGDAHMTRHPAR